MHVFHDGFNVLSFFLRWIGVVKTQVALTAKLGGQSEVEADGLGMADVQVAVWLWRKSGLYTTSMFAARDVLDHDVSNKIRRPIISWSRFWGGFGRFTFKRHVSGFSVSKTLIKNSVQST